MTNYEQSIEAGWQRLKEPLLRADSALLPPAGVLSLARAVAGAPDPDMTCEEAEALLPLYVEDEVAGLPVEQLYPKLKRHFTLCDECVLAYAEMREWALLEDSGNLPKVPFVMPNLSFLPPLSPIERVRLLTEKLIDSLWPALQRKYQATADTFSGRLAKKGANFVFEPQVNMLSGGDKPPTVMQLLRTTHNITHKLVQEWSAEDLEREIKRGTLKTSVRQRAEEEARTQGFSPQEAQRFAEQYTEMVSEDPSFLKSLA